MGLATATGIFSFAGTEGNGIDQLIASYAVDKANAVTVTVHLDRSAEVYTVADGNQLAELIQDQSAWVNVTLRIRRPQALPAFQH